MSLARPWMLLLAVAIPLWLWWRHRHPGSVVPHGDGTVPAGAAKRTLLPVLPPALRALALTCFLVAAAGPQLGSSRLVERREGIAIMIAVDISSSMLAEDFAPSNRLEVAKRQAIAFIRGRTADRIGMVAFAGEALTLVPATLDYPVLERSVLDLRIGALQDGTAIGSGLATAVNRLRRLPERSKVVLLLTDGENNRGAVDPRTAAEAAAAFGIRVYTVGVGTEGEARIPTGRGLSGFRYEMLPVRIDEVLLQEVAATTGGRYFRAKDAEALSRIFRQIDELERTPVETIRYTQNAELARPLLLAGLLVLILELLLGATTVVRTP